MINPKQLSHLLLLLLPGILSGCNNSPEPFFEKTTSKEFNDVIQDVEYIITEKNFRITNKLHIGQAIQERGAKDFPLNEVILFCNLTIAEEMLRLAPQYINYCPYKIAVAEAGGKVTLSTRLLPEKTDNPDLDTTAKNINKILRTMIEYAVSNDPFVFEDNEYNE